MKKLLYLSFLLLLGLVSCTNSEDEEMKTYSCNEEANLWAKNNLKEIKTLTRSEWLGIPNQSYQRAAYVAFTPVQKLNFWLERFEDILHMNWKKEEREHIESVYDFLEENPYIFQDDCSDEERKQFDIFVYQWCDKAVKELGWSQELVAGVIATGYPMIDVQGNIRMPKQINMRQTRSELDCDCHRGNVFFIWCGGLSSYCGAGPCNEKIRSCGAVWAESCDGLCD